MTQMWCPNCYAELPVDGENPHWLERENTHWLWRFFKPRIGGWSCPPPRTEQPPPAWLDLEPIKARNGDRYLAVTSRCGCEFGQWRVRCEHDHDDYTPHDIEALIAEVLRLRTHQNDPPEGAPPCEFCGAKTPGHDCPYGVIRV